MFSYQYPHPAVTTDAIVFTILSEALHVLLIQRGNEPYRGHWAFPGGFIEIDEDLADCVARELQEETGLSGIPLQQFHTFGRPGRDPRERVITVAYLGFVPGAGVRPCAADDAADAAWFRVAAPPPLAFDHHEVLHLAHQRLINLVSTSAAARPFLPASFSGETLREFAGIIGMPPDARARLVDMLLLRGVIEKGGEARYRFAA
ncbi:MAG: NUDIX hydrolase [Gammaproteobacteria bacterium]|jgi:8-oxo-dGTP diphosphatase